MHYFNSVLFPLGIFAIFLFGCQSNEDEAFTLPCPACPHIDGFSRSRVEPGDTLQIFGENFHRFGQGLNDRVEIDGVELLVIAVTDNVLTVVVPFDLRTGPVVVCAAHATHPSPSVRNTLCSDENPKNDLNNTVLVVDCPNSSEEIYETIEVSQQFSTTSILLNNGNVCLASIKRINNNRKLLVRILLPNGLYVIKELDILPGETMQAATATEEGGFVIITGTDQLYFRHFNANADLVYDDVVGVSMQARHIVTCSGGYILVGDRPRNWFTIGVVMRLNLQGRVINEYYEGVGMPGLSIFPVSNDSTNIVVNSHTAFESTNGGTLVLSNQTLANGNTTITATLIDREVSSWQSSPVMSDCKLVSAVKLEGSLGQILILAKRHNQDEYFTFVINDEAEMIGSGIPIDTRSESQDTLISIIESPGDSLLSFIVLGQSKEGLTEEVRGSLLIGLDEHRLPIVGRRRTINRFETMGRSVMPRRIHPLGNQGAFIISGYLVQGNDDHERLYVAKTDCI